MCKFDGLTGGMPKPRWCGVSGRLYFHMGALTINNSVLSLPELE